MSLLDTLRKNLTPELLSQVQDQLGDDFDYDLVPRTRLNTVIKQRNALRDQVAGGSQPASGAPAAGADAADDGSDVETIRQQIQAQADAQVEAVKLEYAGINALRAANVVDPEMVWSSNAISKETLKLASDGRTIEGFDDILAQLKQNKGHLFKVEEPPVPAGTGKEGGDDPFKGVASKSDFLNLSVEEQIEFKSKNPEVFKSFMNS